MNAAVAASRAADIAREKQLQRVVASEKKREVRLLTPGFLACGPALVVLQQLALYLSHGTGRDHEGWFWLHETLFTNFFEVIMCSVQEAESPLAPRYDEVINYAHHKARLLKRDASKPPGMHPLNVPNEEQACMCLHACKEVVLCMRVRHHGAHPIV